MLEKDVSTSTLFVLGSFSKGMVHFRKIEPYVECQRAGSVRGALVRLPSGLIALCPGEIQSVSGFSVTLRKPELLLSLLDEFRGVHHANPDLGLFHRRSITVQLNSAGEDGAPTPRFELAQTYFINLQKIPRGTVQLPDADWRRRFAEQPPLFERLSEKQRSYILKLGGCSGRDIVPIDLDLYRELMHLEIVVDKGRRLALSRLGQDLFRLLN